MNNKISVIGCGNLGKSIINGLLDKEAISAQNITATRRNTHNLSSLKEKGVIITSDNAKAINDSEIIILALKPYNILEVIKEFSSKFDPKKHIVVSLATGITLEQIANIIGNEIPIFRAMPNTAADVAMSLTCISSNTNNTKANDVVEKCFDAIGSTIFINEDLMNSATVLGACGIAFALRFIRGMIQGGIEIGFDAKTATKIVTHTVQGASELLIKRNEHPESEIDKVTTPKGCTIAGLNEMEHNGFSSALIKGIITSYDKIDK